MPEIVTIKSPLATKSKRESAFEIAPVINLVIVPFVAHFPFTVLTVTHSCVTQFTDSVENLVLRLGLLLLLLRLLSMILKSCQVESLGCQIDDNMTIEINGEGIVTVSLDNEALVAHFIPDISDVWIIENGV